MNSFFQLFFYKIVFQLKNCKIGPCPSHLLHTATYRNTRTNLYHLCLLFLKRNFIVPFFQKRDKALKIQIRNTDLRWRAFPASRPLSTGAGGERARADARSERGPASRPSLPAVGARMARRLHEYWLGTRWLYTARPLPRRRDGDR